jgi:SpoVK/Ycf46/Vps4 family AAA+-type ATPase
MKSNFLRNGDMFRPVDPESLNVVQDLPVGTFNVGADPGGFFFSRIEDFSLPAKLYGDTTRHAERIFSTFNARASGTGVLLAGEKGSGKTMLAKKLALMAAAAGMPTIVVNEPFNGDAFNRFIQGVTQPCVVLFDEFEKIYNREQQSAMLTLLDGTFSSKKLCIFTCNDKYRVDSYMRNRPGRIFYSLEFRGLDEGFITEYCQDALNAKENTDGVVRVAKMFSEFNFDMLKALVEEMNRYNETASQAMELLNVRSEMEDNTEYTATLLRGVEPVAGVTVNETMSVHPARLTDHWTTYVRFDAEAKKLVGRELRLDSDGDAHLIISPDTFERVDPASGAFIFAVRNHPNFKLAFKRKVRSYMSYAY